MPYWVYGLDSETGQPAEPFFSEAATEEEARTEAMAQGIVVRLVEWHSGAGTTELPSQPPDGPRPTDEAESARSDYEFSAEQNATIASLAWYMWLLGLVLMVFGAVQLVAGILIGDPRQAAPLIQGLLSLLLGGLTVGAAAQFQQVVDTRGSDVHHLMRALARLKLVYAVQVWLVALALLVAAALLIARWGGRPTLEPGVAVGTAK